MNFRANPNPLLAAILLLATTLPLSAQEPTLRAVLTHTPENHSQMFSVAFSGDGRTLATAGHWEISLWDVATGKRKKVLRDGSGMLRTVTFSRDGKLLASVVGSTITLWDANSGEKKTTFLSYRQPSDGGVRSVAFDGEGKRLASAYGKTIELWDVETQFAVQAKRDEQLQLVKELMEKPKTDQSIIDKKTERVSQLAREIEAEGIPLTVFTGHTDVVRCVVISNDGERIASASDDKTIRLWDVTTGKEQATLVPQAAVNSIALSSDGGTLASAEFGFESSQLFTTVRLWDTATGTEKTSLRRRVNHGLSVHYVAFSNDGKLIASATDGTFVSFWKVATGQQTGTLEKGWPRAHEESATSVVAISPDFQLVAVGVAGQRAQVYLWEMPSAK